MATLAAHGKGFSNDQCDCTSLRMAEPVSTRLCGESHHSKGATSEQASKMAAAVCKVTRDGMLPQDHPVVCLCRHLASDTTPCMQEAGYSGFTM